MDRLNADLNLQEGQSKNVGELNSSKISAKHQYVGSDCNKNYFFNIQLIETVLNDERIIKLEIYIEAPGRGIEIAQEIEEIAQQIANVNLCKTKIVAECGGSIRSTNLYCKKMEGYTHEGNRCYTKEFMPLSNGVEEG